jgi:tRNA nucleotidyltransferase (CCA-adding enzyme)
MRRTGGSPLRQINMRGAAGFTLGGVDTQPAPPSAGGVAAAGRELFQHDADVGVRGWGRTMPEAFGQAGLALTAVVTDPETVRPVRAVLVSCTNDDPELLFVDWLNELVYLMDTRRMLFARAEVRIDGGRLEATVWGEEVDVARHRPAVEIKGATLTALYVGEDAPGRWRAQCIVDV